MRRKKLPEYKTDEYKPEIEDLNRKLRKRVHSLHLKTERPKPSIVKQAIEIGLDVIEKRESIGV